MSAETIVVMALDMTSPPTPLTGITDLQLQVMRTSDLYLLDFNDMTFKNVGWVTPTVALAEIDAVNLPGQYYYDFDPATIANPTAYDAYHFTVWQSPGATVRNVPMGGVLGSTSAVVSVGVGVSFSATACYVGSIGAVLVFTIAGIDISPINGALTLRVAKPSGAVVTWTPTIISGPAGTCSYTTTSAADLDEAGTWKVQGIWIPAGTTNVIYTNISTFLVENTL